ncbi:MAG: DUF1998 domain-containing protein, partial [Thiotrichaceae bacterium]|nr:DUF1998 domain-containing protein [Thiotrichaceae bacterium]
NFLTDEGLLPNYAFPEAGVMLRSVIYRRKNTVKDGESLFENVVYEYERPGAAAISELAPLNRFYAGGRQVSIVQIDMQLSEIEYWRFCCECSYSENITTGDHNEVCPRCSDAMWADSGQRVQMLRLRQVMANTSDKESRIGDEVEDREPAFYTRQMLTDFEQENIEKAWRLVSDKLPFGFEYIKKSSFREINFGEYSLQGEELQIAGKLNSRPGFKVCHYCGMVQKKKDKIQEHAFACKAPDPQLAENLIECLYLYREFSSEAVRILLPVFSVESAPRYLNSFIAAIQLGLKRKFGGQVDHLKVMTYDEPLSDSTDDPDSRRHYLMLYDSVPGGTGYLHELLQTPKHLMEIFQLAKDVLISCSCNQDPQKDGCYQCLYAYRNSYGMETTSRNTAVELLTNILDNSDNFEEVETISAIKVNPAFDSELEARFIEAIRRLGNQSGIKIQQQVINGKAGHFLSGKDRMYEI